MRLTSILLITAASSIGALAQQTPDEVLAQLKEQLAKIQLNREITMYSLAPRSGGVVKNQPYSADATTDDTQTLLNGTHIHRSSGYTIYRDSDGRQRREIKNADGSLKQVTISDPVAGVSYSLNMSEQVATKSVRTLVTNLVQGKIDAVVRDAKAAAEKQALFEAKQGGRGFTSIRPDDGAKQSLGTQTINGVAAEGTRITRTIPVGQIGNDQPIETVNESWYSPELQLIVMTRSNDPRTGESVFQLTNIRRSEPDPSLFQVPANFKIVTQN